MHVLARTAHALLLGTLMGCAEGASGDDGWFGYDPSSEGSTAKLDAGWNVPATSPSDPGFVANSMGEFTPSPSSATARVDTVMSSLPDANFTASDASAQDARTASSDGSSSATADASSSTGSARASNSDAASPQAVSGVAAINDSGVAAGDASAVCSPLRCSNRCGVLRRCCDALNQCACEDGFTRMCTLTSL